MYDLVDGSNCVILRENGEELFKWEVEAFYEEYPNESLYDEILVTDVVNDFYRSGNYLRLTVYIPDDVTSGV